MKNTNLLSNLKHRANELYNEELLHIEYPAKNCMKLIFDSSENAEEFVNYNEFQKNSKGLFIFSEVDFEQDENSVYLTYLV